VCDATLQLTGAECNKMTTDSLWALTSNIAMVSMYTVLLATGLRVAFALRPQRDGVFPCGVLRLSAHWITLLSALFSLVLTILRMGAKLGQLGGLGSPFPSERAVFVIDTLAFGGNILAILTLGLHWIDFCLAAEVALGN
jgi:hypothetical protein